MRESPNKGEERKGGAGIRELHRASAMRPKPNSRKRTVTAYWMPMTLWSTGRCTFPETELLVGSASCARRRVRGLRMHQPP